MADASLTLRQLRQQHQLSQAALEVLSGVSQAEISLIEQGRVRAKPESIVALARALKVDARRLRDILGTTPTPSDRADS